MVPLANDKHGKSTIIRSLVSQGTRKKVELHKKGVRQMLTPWGGMVDAYIFGRSYQEAEKRDCGSVIAALDANDPHWRRRELIVMPSHVGKTNISDIQAMIEAAHAAGFDAVAVPIVLANGETDNRSDLASALALDWNLRWTILNQKQEEPTGQLWALGNDLWSWISRALMQ